MLYYVSWVSSVGPFNNFINLLILLIREEFVSGAPDLVIVVSMQRNETTSIEINKTISVHLL